MRGYAQYCPIAKGSEILGDRWTLLIVREMLGGASGFNELQRGLPGISRSVLADRLRSLERAEIVERRTGPKGRTLDYRLTLAGRDLEAVVQAIGEWGVTWAFTDPRPEELDPDLLIVWMARHVDREQLPPDRTVVQFDFRDPAKRYWMVLEPSEVSVCLQHPRVRRQPRSHGRHCDPLPRLPGARRAGRRAPGSQADYERPEGASARVRTLVRLERVRTRQPAGRRAPQGSVTPRGPPEGAGRTAAADASSLQRMSEGTAVCEARMPAYDLPQAEAAHQRDDRDDRDLVMQTP
jgi:DNA-binding HxlR family transcriptional regulator